MKYYDLSYFRGRKDTGSIYVKVNLDIENFDEDSFLNELVNQDLLTYEEANDIYNIEEISEKTYKDMCGHN